MKRLNIVLEDPDYEYITKFKKKGENWQEYLLRSAEAVQKGIEPVSNK